MPNIDYPRTIVEDEQKLRELEKRHRYGHLSHRVRMLRLLKSGECSSLGEAAESLGYSWRQCQRWFATYRRDGLSELLVSRVGERGPSELVTEEAFKEMEEAMKRGEIATVSQAHRFLWERGVRYSHPESVGGLLRRRKVKLKTGRPRHEKADAKEQEAFKKVPGRAEGDRRQAARQAARQAFEGDGLRRGALRAHKLAPQALLPKRFPPASNRSAPLRMVVAVCSGGAQKRGELLLVHVPRRRRVPASVPKGAGRGVSRGASRGRHGQRPLAPLRRDRAAREHEPPQ